MRLLSWNVNGIRAALKKGFLEWFEAEKPDVLCLQETKLQAEQIPQELVAPLGYKSCWSHAEKKGYSGVAIFVRDGKTEFKDGFGVAKFDSEGRTVVADFGEFVLINGYFPNGGMGTERLEYKLDYYATLLDYIQSLRDSGKHVVITGDYNTAHNEIDLAHPESNRKRSGFMDIEREWLDKYVEAGLVDTFRTLHPDEVAYSWWDYRTASRARDVGWRIDYFFVDSAFMPRVARAFILKDVMGSDHCPVGLEIVD